MPCTVDLVPFLKPSNPGILDPYFRFKGWLICERRTGKEG